MNNKVKIAHYYQELQDQIILTLKDQFIINNGNIDQHQDILQNQQLQQINQAHHNAQLKNKIKIVSDAASSHLDAKHQGQTEILPHYNDYSFKPHTIQIQEGAIIKPRKFKKGKALAEDYQSHQMSRTKLNAQYSTHKKGNTSQDSSRQLLSFLQQTAEDNVIGVKRQYEERNIIEQSINELKKKRILQNEIKNIAQRSHEIDDQQDLLMKSIERSRKKALKSKAQEDFNLLQAIKEEDQEGQNNQQRHVQLQLNPISYKSSQIYRKINNVNIKEVRDGTASAVHINLPSQRLSRNRQPKKQQIPETFKQISALQLQKMREQVKFLEDRQLGIGLAGTLAYLRQNALLGRQEQVGRYNDKSIDYNDPSDRIKLQYRNASGKLMKPKQAYRYICAKFHGEGPGKNKVEMRKKRQIEETRMKQTQNTGGQLMNLLQKHQGSTGEAHMILNFGSKPVSK